MTEVLILLGSFLVLCMLGMPVAYSLGLAALLGSLRLGAGGADPAVAQRGAVFAAAGGTISVAQLFLAGVLPGLLFGACVIGLCLILSYKRGYPKGEPVTLRQAGRIAVDALWGLVTVVIILGGILTGVFTPTESAAVACLYAFLVTMFVTLTLDFVLLHRCLHRWTVSARLPRWGKVKYDWLRRTP